MRHCCFTDVIALHVHGPGQVVKTCYVTKKQLTSYSFLHQWKWIPLYICFYLVYIHRESKKQDTKFLAITSPTIIRFSNFFTSRLGSKFATKSCLNILPRFKHVATLPCEIWMSGNGIILKYVLQLMMNHKVHRPTTHLSFNLLVKEFLKLVNIWQSYRQNGWLCHTSHSPCTFVLKDADFAR